MKMNKFYQLFAFKPDNSSPENIKLGIIPNAYSYNLILIPICKNNKAS